LTDAVGYFETALALKPDLEPAYYELAALKITLDKPVEALQLLDKARERFGRRFAIEYFAAVANSRSKNYGGAVRHFTEAEVIGKANEPERLSHGFYFEFGAALERNGDFPEAEKYFRKCLELSPNFPEAMNYLGYMWADRGENLEEARKLIEKAIELEPESAAYLDSMGWVLFKLKQPREAFKWMQKAIGHSEKPDATLYDHLGDIHAELGEPDQAREAWRKSLDLESNDEVKRKFDRVAPEAGKKD
jgi:tetratricopeptide (TPR) repeat protein